MLGNGDTVDSWVPVKIMTGVKEVSLGWNHSAAIKTDGTLWTWGWNYQGQLGNGTNTSSTTPIKIMSGVKCVSLGEAHSAAVKTDGTLWMWGRNYCGQLGNGTTTDSKSPVKIMDGVKAISLSEANSAAIKTDGSLWIWGKNDCGQIGNGTTTNSSRPVKVMTGVKEVCMGDIFCAVIKTDGSLWMWGSNAFGELGDGGSADSYIPKKITLGPTSGSAGGNKSGVANVTQSIKNTLFGVRLTKVKKGKKSFTAKWKKASKKKRKKFSGYQIQYSTSPNFTIGVKTKSTTKKKASKVVIRKLKAKTNYYVRIRRFKKSGGKVVYSDWSNVKRVRTK